MWLKYILCNGTILLSLTQSKTLDDRLASLMTELDTQIDQMRLLDEENATSLLSCTGIWVNRYKIVGNQCQEVCQ